MLWRRRDLGSDPAHPIFVTVDLPVVDGCITVPIPVAAYKRLADWASLGRTIDGLRSGQDVAMEELEDLDPALRGIHDAIRRHYIALPNRSVEHA